MKVVVERFLSIFREIILAYTLHRSMKGHWLSVVRMLFVVILHRQNPMCHAFIINCLLFSKRRSPKLKKYLDRQCLDRMQYCLNFNRSVVLLCTSVYTLFRLEKQIPVKNKIITLRRSFEKKARAQIMANKQSNNSQRFFGTHHWKVLFIFTVRFVVCFSKFCVMFKMFN